MATAKAAILARCQEEGASVTPIRLQVLEWVLQASGVIKAYQIMAQLQAANLGAVAPPTAYRALDFWAQQGVLHKVPSVNGYVLCAHAEASDAHHEPVGILVCRACGAVMESHLPRTWRHLQAELAHEGFHWEDTHLVLTGTCQACHS